jgi:hypothetical protein
MKIKKTIKAHLPHSSLSRKIWVDENMLPEFREALLKIANAFIDYLGIPIDVDDIIMTGSYANYNYTEFSDIDLHIVIDFSTVNSDTDLVEEFFNAKKSFWNDRHDIELKGIEVELYPQDSTEEHASSGVFSISEDKWLVKPNKFKSKLDIEKIEKSSKKIIKEIEKAIKSAIKASDTSNIERMIKKLKKMRESGLSRGGELSDENVIYKVIRSRGLLQKLFDNRLKIEDDNFSTI